MTTLLSVTASASVLILCVVLLRALCGQRLPAGAYRGLWIAAAVRLLLFFDIPSPVSIFALLQKGGDATVSGTMTGAWHAVIPHTGTASPAPTSSLSPLLILWVAGVVLLAAAFLLPHLRFSLRLRHAVRTQWEGRRILVSPEVRIPCAVGLFSPAVCLPKVPLEYEPDALACILAHENAHIRRGDIFVKWLLAAALSLHWFNPLVWVLYILAGRDMEFACDAAVIRKMGGDTDARARYAAVLLEQIASRTDGLPTAPAIAGEKSGTAKERILRMIQPKKTSRILLVFAVLVCVTVTVVFAAVPPKETAQAPEISIPPAEPLRWTEDTTADTVPADPVILPEDPAPADSLTLCFPLPADSTWKIVSPFGDVTYIPTAEKQDPPFYFLSRIPESEKGSLFPFMLVANHDGVDLAVAEGTDVLAVADGTVLEASYDYERGCFVMIDCGGVIAEYRHLQKYDVAVGDTVKAGDVIAKTGRTGAATGPHLHFSLILDGEYVDPMAYYTKD